MQQFNFRPEYGKSLPWAMLGLVLLFVLAPMWIAFVVPEARFKFVSVAGLGVLFVLLLNYYLYAEIKFGQKIVIRRRFGPNLVLAYSDILDIGIGRLITKKGWVRWRGMQNRSEFEDILGRLIDEGIVPDEQLAGELYDNDLRGRYASFVTGLIVAALSILLWGMMWLGVMPSSWLMSLPDIIQEAILPLGLLLIVYPIVRYGWVRDRMIELDDEEVQDE